MEKTSLIWVEDSKQVILGCSDKLWDVLQKYRKAGVQNLSIIEIAKIYQEIKSLEINLEQKENQNDKS